ncbi:F-box/kelch-repeat protein At3g23880-like [Prosopis cineraria]|uniref:F-box/kelch-repeat protein At3g23880-like n=1 Tax=Prosopis cineraria TaxID=364024 RepID=UPI00240EDF08|nr:F-box/kelch-repeat protein At3g23880-like [Prosopis cineraria]
MEDIVENPEKKADRPPLPRHIIVNILKRLPVKSLIQFQCVCKDWKNLIKSQSFIEIHLHHSCHQNSSLILGWQHSRSFQMQVGLLNHNVQLLEVQTSPLINWIFAKIFGSSNGLLCVRIAGDNVGPRPILLWNPAIRDQVRKVRVRPRTSIDSEGEDYILGFGFSPVDNDYKIVRIKIPKYQLVVSPMEVYSLNSGSWKEVEFVNSEGMTIRCLRNVTVNGVMFWIGGKQEVNDDYTLLSFDLSKEEWTMIPMPDLSIYDKKKLVVYENKLAVATGIVGEDKSYLIHLWVMEEDACGVGWIWTKIFTSRPCPYMFDPLTIWRNEIVFKPFNQIQNDVPGSILYLLNLTTNKFQRVALRSSSFNRINIEVFNYVESLVSVGNINSEGL